MEFEIINQLQFLCYSSFEDIVDRHMYVCALLNECVCMWMTSDAITKVKKYKVFNRRLDG